MNTETLKTIMKSQIHKPAFAYVNSESAFVAEKLTNAGEFQLAKEYWNWHCGSTKNPVWLDDEIRNLESQLESISRKQTIPSWGYSGT